MAGFFSALLDPNTKAKYKIKKPNQAPTTQPSRVSTNRFATNVRPGDTLGGDIIGGKSGPVFEATSPGDAINRIARNYTVDVGDATSRIIQDTFLGGRGKSNLLDYSLVQPNTGITALDNIVKYNPTNLLLGNFLNNKDFSQVLAPGDVVPVQKAASLTAKGVKAGLPVAREAWLTNPAVREAAQSAVETAAYTGPVGSAMSVIGNLAQRIAKPTQTSKIIDDNIDEAFNKRPYLEDDVVDQLVQEADLTLEALTKDNPDLLKLIEDNPDRAIRLQRLYNLEERIGGFDPGVKAALDNVNALNNLTSDIPAGNFNLEGVSIEVVNAVRRGENPVALLLDDKLKPRDFNLGKDGYTLEYKPLDIDDYAAWQGRTAGAGERKIRGTAKGKAAPRGEQDIQKNYDDALASGNMPHRVTVRGGTEGKVPKEYKGWVISNQQEHSIPKSPVGKILRAYADKQRALFYALARKQGRKRISNRQLQEIKDLKEGQIATELSAIINSEDTLVSFPSYYNNLKSNLTTKAFKKKVKELDPEAYELFYGEESDFARELLTKQEILAGRVYDWGRKYNIPKDIVDQIVDYV